MRLVCPNCGAQYAIDRRIIPDAGRDVQCSACSHTWFQAPEPEPDTAAPPKREIDPEVISVLRQEAEHERRARAEERAALEIQGDLDLPSPSHSPSAPAAAAVATAVRNPIPDIDTLARDLPTEDDDPSLRPAPKPDPTRKARLPDIEEINSTLDANETAATEGQLGRPEAPSARIARVRRGQGRRVGFGLACFIFGLATVLYAKGPDIGAAVPAFAPALEAYVQNVDGGRVWLDGLLRRAGGAGA